MRIKIYKRSVVVYNLILFCTLSFFYLHIVKSIDGGFSTLDKQVFLTFLSDNICLVLVYLFLVFSVFQIKKISKLLYIFYTLLITYLSFRLFADGIDKIILILSFIHIVLSYYFYLFLDIELNDVVYKPGFLKSHIGSKSPYNLQVTLENSEKKVGTGYLTNWSEDGLFMVLNEKVKSLGKVTLKINFDDCEFVQKGEVVSKYENGVGVRFSLFEDNKYWGWRDFYNIINDRGYDSNFLGN